MLRKAVRALTLLVLCLPQIVLAQRIDTVVGNAINDGRAATQTPMVKPQGLTFDNNGNLVIADRGEFVIRRVSASSGLATVVAGGGTQFDDLLPIPARTAGLDYPQFLAPATDGTIYFSDFNNFRIRKITPAGQVTTVAGTGFDGYSGDGGRATLADLGSPAGVALDRFANLYFSDPNNSVIRRVNLNTGIITTIAGTGVYGYSGDGGPASQAQLVYPWGLALDAAGNLYVADSYYDPTLDSYIGVVRRIAITNGVVGNISTYVAPSAGLIDARALAFDPQGRLYVTDYYNFRVVRVNTNLALTIVAGGGAGSVLPQDNVLATSTYIFGPTGLAVDGGGNLFISEEGWNLVRRVDAATGRITTFAGTLSVLDNAPAISAPLDFPVGVTATPQGTIYIADTGHERIRRVDTSGNIQTVAGTAVADSAVDGATAAVSPVYDPWTVSIDNQGNLLFTEAYSVVRRLTLSGANAGKLSTVAGRAFSYGFGGENGQATSATLASPWAAISDSAGNIYISDYNNHCVRRVNTQGIIRAVAGICSPGTSGGYSGDGGQAVNARLSYPTGLAFDLSGNLLIADTGNSIVRRLNVTTGVIDRVAGIPDSYGYSGDGGSPLQAEFGTPVGIAVDRTGTIFVTDEGNHAVRYIRGNVILTLAGVGLPGFYGDGDSAEYAWLNDPESIAVDPSGNVLVLDTNNNRLRRITLTTVVAPILSATPTSLTFRTPQNSAAPAAQDLSIRNTTNGFMSFNATVTTTSGGGWLRISASSGTSPATLQVSVVPTGLAPGTYQGTVAIQAPGSSNGSVNVGVIFTIDAPQPPTLVLSTRFLNFDAIQSGSAPSAQILSVSNSGSGTLNWNTSLITSRGGSWLSLSPATGSTQGGGAASNAFVSVNPAGLSSGLYLGIITFTNTSVASAPQIAVAVSLSISAPASRILLSSNTFVFTFLQGANSVPTQSFRVLNTGQGVMSWQAQGLLAQGNWLQISPASGTSDAGNLAGSPTVSLTVDPSSLTPGVYGGLILVQAAGARNNPQFATVLVRVLAPGSPPIPQVVPSGLIFTGNAGSASQVQEVTLQTTGGGNLTYTVGIRTQDGGNWLTASPTSGALFTASDRPRVRVQFAPGGLAKGVYQGAVTFSFSNGTVSEVAVTGILRGPTGASPSATSPAAGECAPTRQVLTSTRLSNSFAGLTSIPVQLAVNVMDDCANALTNSTVAATFSNGDPPVVMLNQQNGQYTGTWVPTRAAASTQVTIRALNPSLPDATVQLNGALGQDATSPIISDNGTVNAASFASFQPVSPGSIVTLFGTNLAATGSCFGGSCASTTPLGTLLGGASVKIGGIDAPLFFAGPGQINAQVPFALSGSSSADIVVTARGVVSAPRTIQLDASQPGIFVTGGTQGAVLIANAGDVLAAAAGSIPGRVSRPANRGEFITIFCTGLGDVTNPPASGAPAPSSPLSRTITAAAVTIGGVPATNLDFQGLAPGFVGLYQINVQVPSNVTPGSAVPLKIVQNGIESNLVTIAVN